MRHLVAGKKLSRDKDHRKALRRNLSAAIIIHGRIKTTLAKAKFVKPFIEKLITIAKKGDLHARRLALSYLPDRFIVDENETDVKRNKSLKVVKAPKLIAKLFNEIAPKYADRPGGYTRIIHLADRRLGDASQLVYLELVKPEDNRGKLKLKPTTSRRKKAKARLEFYNNLVKSKSTKQEKSESPTQQEQNDNQADTEAKIESSEPTSESTKETDTQKENKSNQEKEQ